MNLSRFGYAWGCGSGAISVPSSMDTFQKSKISYPRRARSINGRNFFAVYYDHHVAGVISVLGGFSGPAAIVRRVIFICVNSLQGIFRPWLDPHVLQKLIGRIFPAVTNFDAPSPVMGKFFIGRPVTASLGRVICLQLRRRLAPARMSMRNTALSDETSTVASAAFCRPILHSVGRRAHLLSALTFKKPQPPATFRREPANYSQFAVGMRPNLSSNFHGNML